jgi:hypothetical protein
MLGLAACGLVTLVACGGGGSSDEPVNVDYSALRFAESSEAPLERPRTAEQLLAPLRNGVRLTAGGVGHALPNASTPASSAQSPHSDTSVQVDGVDEADAVKYDGRHIYSARPEIVPASPLIPQYSRNVLDITRTDPATAAFENVSKFVIEGEQNSPPLLYPLLSPQGEAEYLIALSNQFQGWLMPLLPVDSLAVYPDRTTIQIMDVRDPRNVSQAWKLQLDGWLRTSRLIGDTLYVVTSYRPRVAGLVLPADTMQKQQANERRIRNATTADLLPGYAENGGARLPLVPLDHCFVAQVASHEAYLDLVVVSAINVRTRRITDASCLSTDINGVYLSKTSLYVAGTVQRRPENVSVTVLHKFALGGGQIAYRATGAVVGTLGWNNPSYFMDELDDNLRLVTTSNGSHRLTVLREGANKRLSELARLPSAARPATIGKPGESIFAVRLVGERAYVVTFRMVDPLVVIDLHDPADPVIAGELEVPGFSRYLRAVGPGAGQLLLSVGQEVEAGRPAGVKVELFDVNDIAHPQSLGSRVFGKASTFSEALYDPHAFTFLAMPGTEPRYRVALPIQVFDVDAAHPTQNKWTYSGLHLLEVAPGAADAPELRFKGVIKTEEASDAKPYPTYVLPERGVLHGESVFLVHGEQVLSSMWETVPGG